MHDREDVKRGPALDETREGSESVLPLASLNGIRWPVWLTVGVAFANGLFEVLRVLIKTLPANESVTGYLPYGLYFWNRSLSLVFGVALIYLSFNLLRRKRMAWWLAAAGSAVVFVIYVIREGLFTGGFFEESTLAPAVMLVFLLVFRRRFTVRNEPRSLVRGGVVVVLSVLFALGYGTFGFWILTSDHFGQDFSVAEALVQTLREYTFTAGPDTAQTAEAGWFLDSLNVVGALTLTFAAYSLFRPLAYRLRTLPKEQQDAQEVLESHGTSSLDFFKLYPEKSYFFSEDHRAFVAYRASSGAAIALGDTSGPEELLEDTTAGFIRYCEDNGWVVAYHEVLPDLVPMYRHLGMRVVKVGEEAVVDLELFASKTAQSKKLRYARRRYGEREGYSAVRYEPPHSQELLDEAREVSEAWLSEPGRRERGFTLGRFEQDYIEDTSLFVVRDAEESIAAFANLVPSYRPDEATIDLMRHRPEVPNGVMDYLFIELMLRLAEEGYSRFDLGLAPLAGVGAGPKTQIEERGLEQISEHLSRFFSYKGLRDYKSKFDPMWEDRYFAYRGGPPGLVAAGVALIRLTEG